ncbi:hypothetical protein HDK77DRAFT_85916 [Phyllosticta capitalensis]
MVLKTTRRKVMISSSQLPIKRFLLPPTPTTTTTKKHARKPPCRTTHAHTRRRRLPFSPLSPIHQRTNSQTTLANACTCACTCTPLARPLIHLLLFLLITALKLNTNPQQLERRKLTRIQRRNRRLCNRVNEATFCRCRRQRILARRRRHHRRGGRRGSGDILTLLGSIPTLYHNLHLLRHRRRRGHHRPSLTCRTRAALGTLAAPLRRPTRRAVAAYAGCETRAGIRRRAAATAAVAAGGAASAPVGRRRGRHGVEDVWLLGRRVRVRSCRSEGRRRRFDGWRQQGLDLGGRSVHGDAVAATLCLVGGLDGDVDVDFNLPDALDLELSLVVSLTQQHFFPLVLPDDNHLGSTTAAPPLLPRLLRRRRHQQAATEAEPKALQLFEHAFGAELDARHAHA